MSKYTDQRAQKPEIPTIDVMRREDGLLFATFGPNSYNANVESMKGPYFNSKENSNLTFRPATTAESINYIAGNMARVKKEILNPRWAQAGRILRTSEGVFVGLPITSDGAQTTDSSVLRAILDSAERVNGIYLAKKGNHAGLVDCGFAPYESFKTGVQDVGDFVSGGLARVLEHTTNKTADNLATIASTKNYPRGVNVWGFEPAKAGEPLSRVATLDSGRVGDGNWLDVVGGNYWGGDNDDGFAFGVSQK